jgi:hypothetical protein
VNGQNQPVQPGSTGATPGTSATPPANTPAGGGTAAAAQQPGGLAVFGSAYGMPVFGPGGADGGDNSTFSGPGPNVSSGPEVGSGPNVGAGPQIGPPDTSETDAGSIR